MARQVPQGFLRFGSKLATPWTSVPGTLFLYYGERPFASEPVGAKVAMGGSLISARFVERFLYPAIWFSHRPRPSFVSGLR